MNDVIREFLLESHENLGQLDNDLVALEKDPADRQTLARVFRTLHSVKGTAGFIGLPRLEAVAHAAESLLSKLRSGELPFSRPVASGVLSAVDAIRQMLGSIETGSDEGEGDYSALVAELDRLRDGAGKPAAPPPAGPVAKTMLAAREAVPNPDAEPESPFAAPASDSGERRPAAVSDSALRVDVGLLDNLMTLVGELVLARNQIVQFSSSREETAFLGTVQRLDLLTSELQANVMKTRMQPVGSIWSKFPRIVRDLSLACGKQVRFEMGGQGTELDKTIIEAIRDPLTHMVRNAVDHGIEAPAARQAAGKLPEGRISLHASHEGGKVIIELSDDGGGIDPARVRDKAVRSGVVSAEEAAGMSDRELVGLVFLPGFSTAEKVTQFSGRGVGMDVVRTNIEKVGGTVDIDSRLGAGTTVKMKIPLTLAIIPALTISSAGQRYCIPQANLLELVRLEGEQAKKGIESIHGTPVHRLRGNLLPLVGLSEQLQAGPSRARQGEVTIIVLQADDRQFGLVVDDIHDTEEIVVKPLQAQLKGISVFAGATILGDGRVSLILDVLGLARRANVISGSRTRALSAGAAAPAERAAERHPLLLFSTAAGERMAIPLSMVARLEVFPRSSLERAGGRTVVQYRGEILPLLDVSRELKRLARGGRQARESGQNGDGAVQVIVHAAGGRRVGLAVGSILDIVDEEIASPSPASRPGVMNTAIVQGRVTELLDVKAIIRAAAPKLEAAPAA